MGNVISFLGRLGIVRVLSVPVVIGLIIWMLYSAAAPPKWTDEGDEQESGP